MSLSRCVNRAGSFSCVRNGSAVDLARLSRVLLWLLFPLAVMVASVQTQAQAQVNPQDEWQGVERIVVVGDIHGDYESYLSVLAEAGLVNRRGNWAAGDTHFVQIGDLPDRGPDTHKIIAHMQKLERQALRSGGRVHALIGNHEAMNITGDLRYVHPGEYAALKSRRAKALQDAYYERVVEYLLTLETPPVIDENHRLQWNQEFPLGYVEHRIQWSPEGDFGKWVLQHNAVVKINNILFMHAGLGSQFVGLAIAELNQRVRAELQSVIPSENSLMEAEDGPLWYRGLALNDEEQEWPNVAAILEAYQVDHIVVGHTPGYGTIVPRFEGKVLIVDSGISAYYGSHRASLVIESGQMATMQKGEQIALPSDRDELLEYYRRILALEPDADNLRVLIHNLEHPETLEQPAIDDSLL